MAQYFGTDGIRGTFGVEPMTPNFAYRLSLALAQTVGAGSTFVIGRDTRSSGILLERAMQKAFRDLGHRVVLLGVVPTPAVALWVLQEGATFGIALTASHNPAQDNGIKLFNQLGQKLTLEEEESIESRLDSVQETFTDESETEQPYYLGADFYRQTMQQLLPDRALSGMKIVLDCANGATYETSPAVLEALGADLIVIGDSPDGSNINQGVGSEFPNALSETVLESGADIGIAHDGDGDRLVVVDERGVIVAGDQLLGIFALEALKNHTLKAKTLVLTVQSNLSLDFAVQAAGGSVERVSVGDRNVASAMRQSGSNIGGESSGHILFTDFAPTGDGLLAALQLLKILIESKKPLSECAKPISLFPQLTKNFTVKEKIPFDELPNLMQTKATIAAELGDKGRILMRYSGTESKIRLLIEAENKQLCERMMEILSTQACKSLAVT